MSEQLSGNSGQLELSGNSGELSQQAYVPGVEDNIVPIDVLYEKVRREERERIIKLLETEIVNSVTWQAQNRYWNEEWNGGQDSDNQYIQSIAGSLIALIKGENK